MEQLTLETLTAGLEKIGYSIRDIRTLKWIIDNNNKNTNIRVGYGFLEIRTGKALIYFSFKDCEIDTSEEKFVSIVAKENRSIFLQLNSLT